MTSAANQAIIAEMGQSEAVKDAKRELFEEVAHAHYEERWTGSPEVACMTREEFCRKNEGGSYFYVGLNTAWWGFQAGFTAAALAGAKIEVPQRKPGPFCGND